MKKVTIVIHGDGSIGIGGEFIGEIRAPLRSLLRVSKMVGTATPVGIGRLLPVRPWLNL
ncbi:hypothetical protein HanIR_Chr01g0044811 [Helianthus annuus]|nr:hypothetical protein HanIR_Chr01g0044811 [Helianthus annuus]